MTTTAHKVATLRGFKHKQQDTSGCNTFLTHKEAEFDCCLLQELTSGNVTQLSVGQTVMIQWDTPLTVSWPRRHVQTPVLVNKVKMNRVAVQVGLVCASHSDPACLFLCGVKPDKTGRSADSAPW